MALLVTCIFIIFIGTIIVCNLAIMEIKRDLRAWQRYANFCRSCALSGEIPESFEEFLNHEV